ncbi:methylated-DNA--[protein]-cysteine S-methyltransferase [Arthrobacter sp. JSM 101049]|uniref:methylated-DNA--[protein]-cysteine S-methyltransferase n=1 Tax=Arthrobacter sp. JSM 101049 TaxID=929097 RepID=UPI00356723E3
MTVYAQMASPIGWLRLTATSRGLCGVHMQDHAHLPPGPTAGTEVSGADVPEVIAQAMEELRGYFAGTRTTFSVPLNAQGTDFQHRVWDRLAGIPYGATLSYGQLATELGDPHLTRAVGAANGRNPVSIIVPCHRVIGSTGSMTGYGGGIDRKLFLLRLEGVLPPAADQSPLF